MKTKLVCFIMVYLVIGMVIPTFAISPDKNKGDKTKTENLTPAPLPPLPWTLHIVCTDPTDTCFALFNCGNIGFNINRATADCHSAAANPLGFLAFNYGQVDYYQSIPDTVGCVIVTINPGTCPSSYFSSNTCCKCRGDNTPCKLRFCP